MKKLFLTLVLMIVAFPVMAQETSHAQDDWLRPVASKYVCMVNNKAFDTEQIAVDVEGQTYYGCCSMCKAKLQKSTQMRQSVDPVSGETVDKSTAFIGAAADNTVYYFENEENFKMFASHPLPE